MQLLVLLQSLYYSEEFHGRFDEQKSKASALLSLKNR